MKFFFPGTSDYIDPEYDFENEMHASNLKPRDYWYAHQSLNVPPYDGMLISRSLVDPSMSSRSGLYRRWRRLKWEGAKKYLHLDAPENSLLLMGDCGAYSYAKQETPPITTEEAIDFYVRCEVDYALSVDHIISGFTTDMRREPDSNWKERYQLTLNYAREFWDLTRDGCAPFHPIGVAQGWNAPSYAAAVDDLQRMGYEYIALGGLSRLSLTDMAVCLEAIQMIRRPSTRLHLLGVTPILSKIWTCRWGVYSFDCTAPFRQAFLNERDNYHTPNRTYLAIRIPRVDENRTMRRHIDEGNISFREARSMERKCLRLLRSYDEDEAPIEEVLNAIREYEFFFNTRDHTSQYRQLLLDQPWKKCSCQLCKDLGIEIVLLRDKQRNNRRGFHNLYIFYQQLQSTLHNR